jgi:CRISPR-associated Csx2 family protein
MSCVYISFLGTNDYLPCTYFHDERELQNIRFAQEATLHFFCDEWNNNDRILIFATDESYQANWLDDGHKDRITGDIKKCNGLKYCIEKSQLQAEVQQISIPKGQSENEIWKIFQIVYDQLKFGDEVIFDITHAFRSIPMLAIVILNYAKTMKNITLSGIYYGAFEVLGSYYEAEKLSLEKRRAPILDLTAFDQLMEWSFAIDRFTGSGDAGLICKLANQSVKKPLAISKGQNKTAANVRDIAKNLSSFSKTMATCRGRDISVIAGKLKENVTRLKTTEIIRPFKPVFERIKEQFDEFQGNPVSDGIQAAKWCIEHNLIQQGYTILQETLISYFVIKTGKNEEDKKHRKIASQAAAIYLREIDKDKWEKPAADDLLATQKFLDLYDGEKELIKIFRNLSNIRNDLNHAGHNDSPIKTDNFRKKIEKHIKDIKNIIMPSLQ